MSDSNWKASLPFRHEQSVDRIFSLSSSLSLSHTHTMADKNWKASLPFSHEQSFDLITLSLVLSLWHTHTMADSNWKASLPFSHEQSADLITLGLLREDELHLFTVQSRTESWSNHARATPRRCAVRVCVTVYYSAVCVCVAVCCSVLQYVAVCCSVLQCGRATAR